MFRDSTSRSHQLLSLGSPWDPALFGFSGQARQKEQELPMKPLPLELLFLPSIPSCPVSPALVTSSCTQDLSLGNGTWALQGLHPGAARNFSIWLGTDERKAVNKLSVILTRNLPATLFGFFHIFKTIT